MLAQLHVSKTRLPAVPDVVSLRDAGTNSARMEKGGVDRVRETRYSRKAKVSVPDSCGWNAMQRGL